MTVYEMMVFSQHFMRLPMRAVLERGWQLSGLMKKT